MAEFIIPLPVIQALQEVEDMRSGLHQYLRLMHDPGCAVA